MKNLKLLISLSVALGLVGCSPGASEHRKLCKKDAGTVIYKQVESNGFYHAQCSSSCWVQFLDMYKRTGISYIEFNNERTYSTAYIPESGYWRYFIADKSNPLCNKKIIRKLDSYSHPDEFTEAFRNKHCVASKRLEKISARYIFKESSKVISLGNMFDTKIVRITHQLIDSETDELLGETVEYMLNPISGSRIDGGEKSCRKYAHPATPHLYEKVLIPLRNE